MNICFVSNFSKTILYRAIADNLVKNNSEIKIFWIFVDSTLVKYANNDSHILIDLSYAKKKRKEISDLSVNEIWVADRYLSLDKKNGLNYLKNIQEPLYAFIKENAIQYIFGEKTWGHEIVLSRIVTRCPELNCKYLSFSTVRIPSERFAFYEDEKDERILEIANKKNNSIIDFEITKPAYFDRNNQIAKSENSFTGKMNRIKRFITSENIVRGNPCVLHSPLLRLKRGVTEEINKIGYKFIKKSNFENYRNSNYIFYGLHKQPESSIDICGMYYENQYEIIYNLWRVLPPDWFLLVKEHHVAIGDRSKDFYKAILKLKNVILIEERTDSKMIIENAKISATVTGTIALEAGLLGKNAITFGNPFFTRLPNVKHLSFTELSNKEKFYELVNYTVKENEIRAYKDYIMENSFEGNVLDPVTDPDVLKESNILKICKAFLNIIEYGN